MSYLKDPLVISDGSDNNHGLAFPALVLHLASNSSQGNSGPVLSGHKQPLQDHLGEECQFSK